jgi:hypothetical protein
MLLLDRRDAVVALLLICLACDGHGSERRDSSRARSSRTTPAAAGTVWQLSPDSLTATLRLAGGRTLRFSSDTSEQYDRPVRNRYVGTLPVLGYHVVEQDY